MNSIKLRINKITEIVKNSPIGTILSGENEKIIKNYFMKYYAQEEGQEKLKYDEIDSFIVDNDEIHQTKCLFVVDKKGKKMSCSKNCLAGAKRQAKINDIDSKV
jgi:hypothetical protein